MSPRVGDDLWYGPADRWPDHEEPAIHEALKAARKAGWHMRQTLGHGYGRVFCRRVDRGGDACKVIIDTTPRNPESRAKDVLRQVRDCHHRYIEQDSDLDSALGLLDGADRLLDAAEDLLDAEAAEVDAQERWQRAEELLDVAEENAQEFEHLLAEATRFDEEARKLSESAWLKGAEVVGPDGGASAYVGGAQERVSQAGQIVAGVPHPTDPRVDALAARCVEIMTRIVEVRLRLGHT
jgi:hypothetical protein